MNIYLMDDNSCTKASILKRLAEYIGQRTVNQISHVQIGRAASLLYAQVSPRSAANYRIIIRDFLRWLNDPFLVVPRHMQLAKEIADTSRALTAEELDQMLMVVQSEPRNLAIIRLLADTGMTAAALSEVKIADLYPPGMLVAKNEEGLRCRMPLSSSTVSAIQDWMQYRRSNSDYLFCYTEKGKTQCLSKDAIRKVVARTARRAGIQRPITPEHFYHRLVLYLSQHLSRSEPIALLQAPAA